MRRATVSAGIVLGVMALGFSPLAGRFAGGLSVSAKSPDARTDCPVSHDTLSENLGTADGDDTSGLDNHYWAVVVSRGGIVCAVAFSGQNVGAQWLLSRQIAAAKAFSANGLSLDSAPLSTAQLYPWVQPGAPANPLFGLAAGNPVSPEDAYDGRIQRGSAQTTIR